MLPDLNLDDLRSLMRRREGLDLSGIRDAQLARRVAAFAPRHGIRTAEEFLLRLSADERLRAQFIDRVTINVTSLFRNADRWLRLRDAYLEEMGPRPWMWSAGCSAGAETYTMSMLAVVAGLSPRILGTDIDRASLERAARGVYTEQEVREVPPEYRRYLHATDEGWEVGSEPRRHVRFRHHDLLADPLPEEHFDLVVCRNVAIYFSEEAKLRLHDRLASRLRTGGVMFIGGAERIANPAAHGLEYLEPQLYRRTAIERRRTA